MSDFDVVTPTRLAAMVSSGFESEKEMGLALLTLISNTGEKQFSNSAIAPAQRTGVAMAIKDTPIAYDVLNLIIDRAVASEEDKANLRFMLIKMMDDLFSLGALIGVNEKRVAFSVLEGARSGGLKSGEARRLNAEEGWKAIVRPMIDSIEANNPHWSQDDVSTEVRALWKGEGKPPSHSSVKGLVAAVRKERTVNEPPSTN